MSPVQAAFAGSKEIYFAVISTTITLAAVFMPIIFMGGISGQLFKEFAIVVFGFCNGVGICCINIIANAQRLSLKEINKA